MLYQPISPTLANIFDRHIMYPTSQQIYHLPRSIEEILDTEAMVEMLKSHSAPMGATLRCRTSTSGRSSLLNNEDPTDFSITRPFEPGRPSGCSGRLPSDTATSRFDGTAVLCQVCGDKASGFHYGVHACEGCKGFFRRSIQQKIQYRPCAKNQQCSVMRANRNRCQYCRLKKCIEAGMSREAVRFGRVPKPVKEAIKAQMKKASAETQKIILTAELHDDDRIIASVLGAHHSTCRCARRYFTSPSLDICGNQSPSSSAEKACPFNANSLDGYASEYVGVEVSSCHSEAIRGVVEFAKSIPGFHVLPHQDKVTLLKAGVYEVLLLRLAHLFDPKTHTLSLLDGTTFHRDASKALTAQPQFLVDSLFDFVDRFNNLSLHDADMALFSAIVLMCPERPGLGNPELVQQIHKRLMDALLTLCRRTHPENSSLFMENLLLKLLDLRTLNTLHSERLLAFRMEPKDKPHVADSDDKVEKTSISSSSQSHTGNKVFDFINLMSSAASYSSNGEQAVTLDATNRAAVSSVNTICSNRPSAKPTRHSNTPSYSSDCLSSPNAESEYTLDEGATSNNTTATFHFEAQQEEDYQRMSLLRKSSVPNISQNVWNRAAVMGKVCGIVRIPAIPQNAFTKFACAFNHANVPTTTESASTGTPLAPFLHGPAKNSPVDEAIGQYAPRELSAAKKNDITSYHHVEVSVTCGNNDVSHSLSPKLSEAATSHLTHQQPSQWQQNGTDCGSSSSHSNRSLLLPLDVADTSNAQNCKVLNAADTALAVLRSDQQNSPIEQSRHCKLTKNEVAENHECDEVLNLSTRADDVGISLPSSQRCPGLRKRRWRSPSLACCDEPLDLSKKTRNPSELNSY